MRKLGFMLRRGFWSLLSLGKCWQRCTVAPNFWKIESLNLNLRNILTDFIKSLFGFFKLCFHDSGKLHQLFVQVLYLKSELPFNFLNLFILLVSHFFSLFKNIFLFRCHLFKFSVNRFKLGQKFLLKGLGTDWKHLVKLFI